MTGYLRAAVTGLALIVVSGCGGIGDPTLGELVAFEQLAGSDHPLQAVELDTGQEPEDVFVELQGEEIDALPPLAGQTRRFGFIAVGCRQDSAQLVVQDGGLDAQLLEGGSTEQQTDCGQAVYFLTVFDVPADDLPGQVRLP